MAGEAQVEPFHLDVPQAALDDLKHCLAAVRWPDRELVGGWAQGVPLARLRALIDYWQGAYDRISIDGLGVHFLHVRSPEAGALPLLMTRDCFRQFRRERHG